MALRAGGKKGKEGKEHLMKLGFGDWWGWLRRHWRLKFRYADFWSSHQVEGAQVRVMNAAAAQPYLRQADAAEIKVEN